MREIFYRIVMKTKSGKKLYLKCTDIYTNDKIRCEWEFSSENAIWFDTDTQAEKFCNMYFKNFKNYEIEEFEYCI